MPVSASRSAGSGRSPAASACRNSARRDSTRRVLKRRSSSGWRSSSASSEPRMASAGMARRLLWKFSRIARAWARGVGAPAGGSSTRSEPITAAASSALFR